MLLADHRHLFFSLSLFAVAACSASPRRPVPEGAEPTPGAGAEGEGGRASAGAPQTAADSTEVTAHPTAIDRWLRLAFTHAEIVAAVEVVGEEPDGRIRARVLEEIRGFKTAKVVPLTGLRTDGAPTAGQKWIVALHRNRGAAPDGGVLAQLPYSDDNLVRARSWALPPWRYVPIVLAVEIAEAPTPGVGTSGGRVVFRVVEELRGQVAVDRLTDNAWPFAKFRPFVADSGLYILSAWGVSKNKWVAYPMVHVASLMPIEKGALDDVRRQVAAASYDGAIKALDGSAAQIAGVRAAWSFRLAPHVAEVEVGAAAEEATGCGGHHYTLVPVDWLRGEVEAGKLGTQFSPPATLWQLGSAAVTPYLFYGGGHCYYGSERPGQRYFAAGWGVGGFPSALVEAGDGARERVLGWMNSGLPRFAARPVEDAVFTSDRPIPSFVDDPASTAALEPDLRIESLSGAGVWARFEVVRRRTIELPNGREHTWIHCRLSSDQSRHGLRTVASARSGWQSAEWMFEGTDLPDWQPGSTWWGVSIDAGFGGAWGSSYGRAEIGDPHWADHRLFFASTFLPAGDRLDLDRLLAVSRMPLAIAERQN